MAALHTIPNEEFVEDDVPTDEENFCTESEVKMMFLMTVWHERENIMKFVSTRTPEELQQMDIGVLLDMMVGSVFNILDGLNPLFPPVDLNAYPVDGEIYYTPEGEEKPIEEGTMINDNFLGEEWENLVIAMNAPEE